MKRWTALLASILAAGCASVGGSTPLHPGLSFPATDERQPIAIYGADPPECDYETIGTVEAHAPVDASEEELEETERHHRSPYIEEAEREALREMTRLVRKMGGHAVIDFRESVSGARAGESAGFDAGREEEGSRTGSVSLQLGSERPKYRVEGTVIRFSDPNCMK